MNNIKTLYLFAAVLIISCINDIALYEKLYEEDPSIDIHKDQNNPNDCIDQLYLKHTAKYPDYIILKQEIMFAKILAYSK